MITVYHVPHSRSQRVVWLMEELGEEYRVELLALPFPDSFRELNPLGTVPFIDDDGIGMGESLAILQYITGRRLVAGDEKAAGLTVGPRPDPAAYAEHLQFLHFGEAGLTGLLGTILQTRWYGPEGAKSDFTTERATAQFERRLAFLDAHLADGREWVTGETFTIADISIGYALELAVYLELDQLMGEHVQAYWERLQARPAYQRAQAD